MNAMKYYRLLEKKCKKNLFPCNKINDPGYCLYRGEEGKCCAIGVCIPDKVYKPDMEGYDIEKVVEKFPEVKEYLPEVSLDKLREIQRAHDVLSQVGWNTNSFLLRVRELLQLEV